MVVARLCSVVFTIVYGCIAANSLRWDAYFRKEVAQRQFATAVD